MADYDSTKNKSITEYESDGNIYTYSVNGGVGGIYDIKTDSYVKVAEVTQPAPSPSKRPATWLDAITPSTIPSPWTPPQFDPLTRKALNKLGEEVSELSTVLFRIQNQTEGLDALIPGETKTNRQWLEEKIADVLVTSALAVKHLKLDIAFIEERSTKKNTYLEKWYMMEPIDPNGHNA